MSISYSGEKDYCEIWLGHSSNLKNLRIFGYIAYAHIRQDKLIVGTGKCMFLGYHEGVRAYKSWCLELRFKRCMTNYHVIFNEIVRRINQRFLSLLTVEMSR